jgi:nucleoside phosphorylase
VATELTCILFALDREAMAFRQGCSGWRRAQRAPIRAWHTQYGDRPLLVLITGMGRPATERALAWALDSHAPFHRPDQIISAGFCGALVENFSVGDLLIADEVFDSAGLFWPIPGRPTADSLDCVPIGIKPAARRGRLLSVAAPVLSLAERQALHRETGALAVDMETATAARCCAEAGIPFASLRAVSDALDTPISRALSAALSGEHVSLRRLALAVIRWPSLVVELARLARQSRAASEALARGLCLFLRSEVTSR